MLTRHATNSVARANFASALLHRHSLPLPPPRNTYKPSSLSLTDEQLLDCLVVNAMSSMVAQALSDQVQKVVETKLILDHEWINQATIS